MYKRKFKYETFDGRTVEETWCFHMYKAEITKWLTTNEDCTLDKILLKMTEESRGRDIMDEFDKLIRNSVGKISADGKRFIKNDEITEEFVQSEPYSELFMDLISSGEKAASFIKAIIPDDFSKEIEVILKENPEGIPDELKDYLPDNIVEMPGAGADA